MEIAVKIGAFFVVFFLNIIIIIILFFFSYLTTALPPVFPSGIPALPEDQNRINPGI